MTVRIEILGDDAGQVLSELKAFSTGLFTPAAPVAVAAAAPAPAPQPEAPAPEKAPRNTRKPRNSAAATAAADTQIDDATTEAQDKADEQAEVEESRDTGKPLTIDDVKAAMSKYVEKYGMPATQEDGPKIFVEALGAAPAGEPYWKLSLLADADQDKLKKLIAIWNKATELNPLKRTPV